MEALDPLRSVQSSGDNRLRATVFGILESTDRAYHATELAKVVPGSRQSISKVLKEAKEEGVVDRTGDGFIFTQRGAGNYRSVTYDIEAGLKEYIDEAPVMQMYQAVLGADSLESSTVAGKMMRISGLETSGKAVRTSIDVTPGVAATLVESMWMSDPDELGPWSLRESLLKTLYSEFDRQPILRLQPGDGFVRHEARVIEIPEPVVETAVALGDIELEEEFQSGANYRLLNGRRGGTIPEVTDDMKLSL